MTEISPNELDKLLTSATRRELPLSQVELARMEKTVSDAVDEVESWVGGWSSETDNLLNLITNVVMYRAEFGHNGTADEAIEYCYSKPPEEVRRWLR